MRGVFLVGSVLVTAAGLQLYVGTEKTDQYFAWHVKNFMAAAFLGGWILLARVYGWVRSGRTSRPAGRSTMAEITIS
jgi:hypothetical protein